MLYHTSPNAITENKKGRFGDFLFFSSDVYSTQSSNNSVIYEINSDDMIAIEARSLAYRHDLEEECRNQVDEVMELLDVDAETAIELICEEANSFDFGGDGDDSWEIQRITAECAAICGYDCVQVTDEQGAAYMIDMSKNFSKMSVSEKQ